MLQLLLKNLNQSCQRLTDKLNNIMVSYQELQNTTMELITNDFKNKGRIETDFNTRMQIWKSVHTELIMFCLNLERFALNINTTASQLEKKKLNEEEEIQEKMKEIGQFMKLRHEYKLICYKFKNSN